MVEGYKKAYDRKGEDVGYEFSFLVKNEREENYRDWKEEHSLKPAQLTRGEFEDFAVVKAYEGGDCGY